MLQVSDVWFGFDDEFLFENLSFDVHAGHKLGIVGRNGIGKTTIFNLIRRELIPEEGEVILPPRWRLAWLRQDTPATERTAVQFVLDGDRRLREVERQMREAEARDDMNKFAELHDAYDAVGGFQAEARAAIVLTGLGFEAEDFNKPYSAFSGGWRIRLNLAQTLSQPSEVMLLDEPTNHLDLEATVWLQKWLKRYQGTTLCISHDREFLDQTVDAILHLDRRTGTLYRGNYSSYERQRAEHVRHQTKLYEHQEGERKRIQRFIDRFRTYATKAKQVQSRIKMLERMQVTAPLRDLSPYGFSIQAPGKMDRPMLSIDDATLGYGEKVVLSEVTERIYPGDRIALLGLNGAGKSTFLKSLAGELPLIDGTRDSGLHASIGYFAQHQLELLDKEASAFDHVKATDDIETQKIRNFLGGWGFHGDDIFRSVGTFSGGEKARLVLALITRQKPSLLVLDEPTNHLDVEMREALTSALNQYEGAVLMVAHDQHLLNQCADEFWLVKNGRISHFDGDLSEYEATVARDVQVSRSTKSSDGRSRKELRRERALERENRRHSDKERLKLEAKIEELQLELDKSSQALADGDALRGVENRDLQAKFKRHGRIKKQLDELEKAWSALVDAEFNEDAGITASD